MLGYLKRTNPYASTQSVGKDEQEYHQIIETR